MEGSEKYPLEIEKKLARERQHALARKAKQHAKLHPADEVATAAPGALRRALRRVSAAIRRA
jgi:hypothetical protein